MLTHEMTHVLVTARIVSASLFGCFQNGMGRDELKISTSPLIYIFFKASKKRMTVGGKGIQSNQGLWKKRDGMVYWTEGETALPGK